MARRNLIPELEKDPKLLELAETNLGRVLVVVLSTLLLIVDKFAASLEIGAGLLFISLLPRHRRVIVAITTLVVTVRHPPFLWEHLALAPAEGWPAFVLAHRWLAVPPVLAVYGAYLVLVNRFRRARALRAPLATFVVAFVLVLAVATWAPMSPAARVLIWLFAIVASRYVWFLGYALADRKPGSLVLRLATWSPFWGRSNVPFPKGEAYLRSVEAKDSASFAVTQLKGLKLMLWGTLLSIVVGSVDQVLLGEDGPMTALGPLLGLPLVPKIGAAVYAIAHGRSLAPWLADLAVLTNFTTYLLRTTAGGHVIIGACRVAGFGALRNTWRPLEAKTVAEFYNRIYYYFKELLADQFFYPTYLRFFKTSPRVRLVFATMMAAGFGNWLFHFLRDVDHIMDVGLGRALVDSQVYAFYALVLGASISVSQLREVSRRKAGRPAPDGAGASFWILAYYCLLMIFNEPNRSVTLRDYFAFIGNLVSRS